MSRDQTVVEQPARDRAAPVTLEESYRYCRDVTRVEAKNFYYTFWLLPRQRRSSIYAVYTFSRRLDDIVDGNVGGDHPGATGPRPEQRIESPREALEYMRSLLGPQAPAGDPLVPALQDTIETFQIPRAPFDDLVEGMVMDLEGHDYQTYDDLRLYCYRAASTVGLICIEIFGHELPSADSALRDPAVDLGLAMQLTNILRDIPEDLSRDRIYLPRDELERFGVSEADLRDGRVTENFRELMRFQVARAREHFERAEGLFPHLRKDTRYCPMLLKRFYSELLTLIERMDYDVFRRRPRLSRLRKVWLAGSWWVRQWRGPGHGRRVSSMSTRR